uniref:LIM domain binding 2 n=1 Tax=Anas platyrhynchos TaxID=8839 RepID=A0A8B9TLB8_ANAPL
CFFKNERWCLKPSSSPEPVLSLSLPLPPRLAPLLSSPLFPSPLRSPPTPPAASCSRGLPQQFPASVCSLYVCVCACCYFVLWRTHSPCALRHTPYMVQPEYRIYEMNKRLQSRTEDSDNLWWDAFATEFFEDDATLTLSFCLEDGPKRYKELPITRNTWYTRPNSAVYNTH